MFSEHISEFSGLSNNASLSLLQLAHVRYTDNQGNRQTPFILFTDPVENGRGIALFNYIKKHGFGKVWESEQQRNPNSSRQLKIYTFAPDDAKLKEWYTPRQKAYEEAYEKYREASRRDWRARFEFDPESWKEGGDTFIDKAKKIIKSVTQ